MGLKDILGGVLGTVTGPVITYVQRKAELKAALHEKKLEGIQKAESANAAWELAQIANSGWKDEYHTILLSIPFVMCYIPFMAKYVGMGFAVVATTPRWYQYLFATSVLTSFGLKTTDRVWKWWNSP